LSTYKFPAILGLKVNEWNLDGTLFQITIHILTSKKMKMENNKSNKVIVILGPTASGKSDVAIWLARK